MNLKIVGQDMWNEAYDRGGNIVFYPHEEIVRFLNKYVRKRTGITTFKNIMPLTDDEWKKFASLDLGCGIGRHIRLLDEFGLNPYGIDLPSEAVIQGRTWMCAIGKQEQADKMSIGSVTELPYENEFFNICVSHSVLDCMPRKLAQMGIREAFRVLKSKGLMYMDFYMDNQKGDCDEQAMDGFDKNTIKSYFTVESIKEFIGDQADIKDFKIIRTTDADGRDIEYGCRAHLVMQKIS